jgi:hypothetical protein
MRGSDIFFFLSSTPFRFLTQFFLGAPQKTRVNSRIWIILKSNGAWQLGESETSFVFFMIACSKGID